MGEVTQHPATSGGPAIRAPEHLSPTHDLSSFDCGHAKLNLWLIKRAMANDGYSARTFVVAVGPRVIGYYCLATGAVMRKDLPSAKLRQNLPEQVPVVVIGRLAVDKRFQSRGFGAGLLRDAILRVISAAEEIGVRAVIVHAIDDPARDFYLKYGFLQSEWNDRTLFLPIETAKEALR